MQNQTLILLLASLSSLGIADAQRRPLDADAIAQLRADEPRRLRFINEQLPVAKARLGLGDLHALELRSYFTDEYGRLHARFRQRYKGLRVLGAVMIAHLDDLDRSTDPTAKVYADIDLDVTPVIDEASARQVAAQPPEANLKVELVIVPERVLQFSEDAGKRSVPSIPSIDEYQWIVQRYVLAWYVTTSLDDDTEPAAIIVDATTGLIRLRSNLQSDDSPRTAQLGSAQTLYYGLAPLSTSRNEDTQQFELTDVTRDGNTVLNLNGSFSRKRGSAQPFTSSSNAWGDGKRYSQGGNTTSANGQTPAAEVAYGVERTWDLLKNVFSHEGLDGRGAAIDARVHYGTSFGGAHWHRGARAAFFGDGGPQSPTDIETVGHELGHGLWFSFIDAEGGDDSEADGIGQGNADILGSLAEFYLLGNRGLGSALADIDAPWNFRARMINPTGQVFQTPGGAPQTGLAYWTANAAAQEEHAVGALYGHLFVILARGASSQSSSPLYSRFFPNGLPGLGLQAAADLWYVATTSYLPDEPNFFDLRQAYLQAAAFLYGAGSTQTAIVNNAFAAVGLGSAAVDATAPAVTSLTIQNLDEAEGSMLVSANAFDDTGVLSVEFLVDNRSGALKTRPPYSAYLNIGDLAIGSHTLTGRALDYTNKVGFTVQQFAMKGVNNLIQNGNFERGSAGWNASLGVIRSGPEAFLGNQYAGFAGNGFLSQQVTVPASSTAADLSFRVRVDNDSNFPTGAKLELQIRDDKGVLIETLGTFFDNFDTRDELARNYLKRTYSLLGYLGRKIEIRFVSGAAGNVLRFRVDNINVVTTDPIAAETSAEVDEGEGSLILRLKNLSGIRPSQISRVDYLIDGVVSSTSTSDPFLVLRDLQGLPAKSYALMASLYDQAGQKLLDTPVVNFTVGVVNQLIRNNGFESAALYWTTTGQTTFPFNTETLKRAFLGTRAALLGGSGAAHADELYQVFTIPETAASAMLSFRLRIDTQERQPNDTMTVRVFERDGGGNVKFAGSFDSQTNTKGPESINGYVKRTFDLSFYIGKQIVLFFQGRENTGGPTSFLVDNVSVTWK